jgi:hypothetical protein
LVNSVIAAFPAPYRFSGVSHVFPVHPDSERVDAERGYVGPVVDIYIIPFVCDPGLVASQGISGVSDETGSRCYPGEEMVPGQ